MRAAIIDMGTNTFHLLIAEIESGIYQILLEERIAVKIGAGGINQGIITDAGVNRAVNALRPFKSKSDELGVEKIFAFGTSALRNAKNRNEVLNTIKNSTGIETEILSGEEEALYIYRGVNLALQLGEEKALIMDIGGGSVEFIIGNGKEIFWKESFEIGAQRLLERYQPHDPIHLEEIDQLKIYFQQTLSSLKEMMNRFQPKILAGSSGTFDTLSEIYCRQNKIAFNQTPETPFALEAFKKIYDEICSKNRSERLAIPGMIELRVDMIVVACCLIDFILTEFQFEKIRISSYSLKEGVLASVMNNIKITA